jgi:hypothetical protein
MKTKCIIKYIGSTIFSRIGESISNWWKFNGKDTFLAISSVVGVGLGIAICLGTIHTGIGRLFFDQPYIMESKILTILLNGGMDLIIIIAVFEVLVIAGMIIYAIYSVVKIPFIGLYKIFKEAKKHCGA